MHEGAAIKVRMEHVSKSFPGVLACDNISLSLEAGETMAVIGENGAGKSTLMNILEGLYMPTSGRIYLDDKLANFTCPGDALAAGIGMVHQRYMLVPDLTVWENVAIGMQRLMPHSLKLDENFIKERIQLVSTEYGLSVNPDAYIWQLSVGEQQKVELVKTLCMGARLLILDEPTSALTPQETDDLIALLKKMRGKVTILFISHKLGEVKALCEKMIVMRIGRLVFSGNTADYTASEIAAMMTGHDVSMTIDCPAKRIGGPALVLEGIRVKSDRGYYILDGLNLTVREGEILGLAGVSGNGQRELAEALNGLRKIKGGKATLYGKSLVRKSPRHIINLGMGYVPEERNIEGIVPSMSIKENLILKDIKRFGRLGIILSKKVKKNAEDLCKTFDVRAASLDTSAGSLSGGNIQKVILAREISRNPKFLVCVYPIRGLDLGAVEFIHQQLLKLRNSGVGILLISEEMDELLNMSDRIAVIFKGKIMKIMERGEADSRKIGILMAGVSENEEK